MNVGIVTGAARGMGRACAERVAHMVDVWLLVDRDELILARPQRASRRATAGEGRAVRARRQGP